ncbi:MAG: bifunctional hydroxymethylpyrimidine kinase/phosphomethylpyrimidine kinase [Rhodospirillales bacterium]
MKGRVLIVAGSDSSGGAGIQADIKTVTALGGYAATAITAVTVQNTQGVTGVHGIPPDVVAAQMRAVLSDIGADVVKIGMLHAAAIIDAVADVLMQDAVKIPVVLDPVMIAKGGHPLLEPAAETGLRRRLMTFAYVLTPNIPEAEALTGAKIVNADDMERAAHNLKTFGPKAIMVKGGHLPGGEVTDVLLDDRGSAFRFTGKRIDTPHTHGTGCTLASAIATGLAQGMSIRESVVRARAYVLKAIKTAPGYGHGHGPLNHGHTVGPFEG